MAITNKAPHFTLRRRSFLAGGSALALAALTWPKPTLAQAADLGGRDPKTLVVLVDATVGNLDPATNVEWAYGLRPVYETLTALDGTDTLSVIPALATTWVSNADQSSWTFTLAPACCSRMARPAMRPRSRPP